MTLKHLHNERKAVIEQRIKTPAGDLPGRCVIPDCGRPTMRSVGVGLAAMHCRYHVQFRARHGSHWCPTYKAADLKPYLAVAVDWINQQRAEPHIGFAVTVLRGLLDASGRPKRAQDLKRLPAATRARIAFARLREAHIQPERLLAIHMGVSALIAEDAGSHNVTEFRIVQVAKAAHRLAGTHSRWDYPRPDGSTYPLALHTYPKSSGRVLRAIGGEVEEACFAATEKDPPAFSF